MDPNEALATARAAARTALHTQPDDPAEAALQTTEAFDALDEWLSKGGFLPEAWSRRNDPEVERPSNGYPEAPGELVWISGDWLHGPASYDADAIDRYDEVYEGVVGYRWGGGVEWLANKVVADAVVLGQQRYRFQLDETSRLDTPEIVWDGDTIVVTFDGEQVERIGPREDGLYQIGFGFTWHVIDDDDVPKAERKVQWNGVSTVPICGHIGDELEALSEHHPDLYHRHEVEGCTPEAPWKP